MIFKHEFNTAGGIFRIVGPQPRVGPGKNGPLNHRYVRNKPLSRLVDALPFGTWLRSDNVRNDALY
jgi:hypothetical protein